MTGNKDPERVRRSGPWGSMFMPQTQMMTVLAEPLCDFPQRQATLARPLTPFWMCKERSRGLVPGCWGMRAVGAKLS